MDERQTDIFGAVAPPLRTPPEPPPTVRKLPRRRQDNDDGQHPPVDSSSALADAGIDAFAARASPADLDDLAAALPDDALAHLVLAAMRQLRRRLARAGNRGSKSRGSDLERTAQQVAAELGGTDGGDYA